MHPSYRFLPPLALALALAQPAAAQTVVDPVSLLNDVKYLSSDSLGGRLIGTPGADSAAAYLARRFKQSGLRPAPQGWFQSFTVSPTHRPQCTPVSAA